MRTHATNNRAVSCLCSVSLMRILSCQFVPFAIIVRAVHPYVHRAHGALEQRLNEQFGTITNIFVRYTCYLTEIICAQRVSYTTVLSARLHQPPAPLMIIFLNSYYNFIQSFVTAYHLRLNGFRLNSFELSLIEMWTDFLRRYFGFTTNLTSSKKYNFSVGVRSQFPRFAEKKSKKMQITDEVQRVRNSFRNRPKSTLARRVHLA